MIHSYPPVKTEPTECSETSVFNIQMPRKYPEENILATFQPSYHSHLPTCEDGTDSVPKRRLLIFRRRGNNPEENIPYLQHGESLKTTIKP
jgi:hypothetical protein